MNITEQIAATEDEIKRLETKLADLRARDAAESAPIKVGQRVTWTNGKRVGEVVAVHRKTWPKDTPWTYVVNREFKNGKAKREVIHSWQQPPEVIQ